jgi:26-hydroxylase
MSVRFSADDPKFLRFNFLIEEGMRLFGQIHTIDYFPKLQYLPKNCQIRNEINQNRQEMFSFYREVIEEHKNTFDETNIRDLIDTYLHEIEKAKRDGCENELFEGKNHGNYLNLNY